MAIRDIFRPRPLPVELPTAAAVVAPVKTTNWRTENRNASEAWEVWRKVGEIHYATTQQARLVSRLDWNVTIDGEALENDAASEMLTAAFGTNLRDLTREAALHLQVPGGYLLARTVPGDPESWRVMPNPPSHKERKQLDRSDVIVSVRNPDPKDEDLQDSPVLASLDIARELILARAMSRAQSRSRTAQLNTLLYPLEGAGGDPAKFEADLTEVMVAPLADERTTASVVPNLIGFPAELIKEWRTLDLSGPIDDKIQERVESLVRQLSLVMDVPPEIMTGFGETNHWSAWAIQEDNWLGHVEPLAQPIGRGLAEAIRQASGLEGTNLQITPDPGPLLQRRPSPSDALSARQAGIVSDEWTREQIGAGDMDAPPDAEQDQAVTMAIDLASKAPSLLQAPGLPAMVEQIRAMLSGSDAPVLGEVVIEDAPAVAEPEVASLAARITAAIAPDPEVDARALADIDTQVYDAVQDLVLDTAERAVERLGAKVRSIAQGRKVELPDVPNSRLAVLYDGEIPNADAAVQQTVDASLPKLKRSVERAFSRVRAEGIDVALDDGEWRDAVALYSSLTGETVRIMLEDRPVTGEAWAVSRRVVSAAGGNGDPAAAVAASGIQITGTGIALGKRTLDYVRDTYRLVPGEWQWVHVYDGANPHPEHVDLNGETFNGEYVLRGGTNWFPGDHAGCRCQSVPRFERMDG